MSNDETQDPPDSPKPPADPSFGAPDAPPQNLPATAPKREPVLAGERGIQIRSLADLAQFSKMIYDSGMAPKGFKTPQSVAVAVQKGLEHGLLPLQALQSVYVVNSMPAWTGKAALGLVMSSGLMVAGSYRLWIEGTGDKMVAWCESRRVGRALVRTSFSVEDAKVAKLWQKRGYQGADTPWITFPKRMLGWKVVSHHLNDNYPDVLGGMPIAEDVIDVNPTRDTDPEQRKSLVGTVAGVETTDPLLEAAGVKRDPNEFLTRKKTAEEMAADVAEEEADFAKMDADRAKAEGRFRDFMAFMDEASDVGELEIAREKAHKAAGGYAQWEAEAENKFQGLRSTRFGNVRD